MTLRGLLQFKKGNPIPIEEVEPVESIFKRFATGAMSFGSISWEAHTTLAIAMNRIGGKSNSGEGGEDELRLQPACKRRQHELGHQAGCFGTFWRNEPLSEQCPANYRSKWPRVPNPAKVVSCPALKWTTGSAAPVTRRPAWVLISPPPHHDIYSIEDLAQLIFDLKNANREARISVKLVSEAGVGTVATGVAKAHADHILISGYDGGTGASPFSSIRHAGLPWELGSGRNAPDPGKKQTAWPRYGTGRWSDAYRSRPGDCGHAWAPKNGALPRRHLVAAGCIMMRKCHLNTCPVGVATQNKELRALFTGKPEHVVNMFTFMAEELREIMAQLGFRTVNEMVGQVQYLETRQDLKHWKYKNLNLDAILYKEEAGS